MFNNRIIIERKLGIRDQFVQIKSEGMQKILLERFAFGKERW